MLAAAVVSLYVVPVPGGAAICAKLEQPAPVQRSIRYPATATLSVAAPQLRSIRPLLIADAVNVPGADGATVSAAPGVTAVEVFEYKPRFGTASAARTR